MNVARSRPLCRDWRRASHRGLSPRSERERERWYLLEVGVEEREAVLIFSGCGGRSWSCGELESARSDSCIGGCGRLRRHCSDIHSPGEKALHYFGEVKNKGISIFFFSFPSPVFVDFWILEYGFVCKFEPFVFFYYYYYFLVKTRSKWMCAYIFFIARFLFRGLWFTVTICLQDSICTAFPSRSVPFFFEILISPIWSWAFLKYMNKSLNFLWVSMRRSNTLA